MARLFTQSINPFTEKVAAALVLKGIPFEREVSDDPDFVKQWSPVTGRLPVLEIDGERITDSGVIVTWLEEHYPEPSLLSSDPKTADAQRSLAEWSDTSFLWYWDRWRMARFPRPGDEQPADASVGASLRTAVERIFGRPPSALSRVELREVEVMNGMAARLDDLVTFLGDRPFFHADEPSLADLSVCAMLRTIRDGPMPAGASLIASRRGLTEYMARVAARTRKS